MWYRIFFYLFNKKETALARTPSCIQNEEIQYIWMWPTQGHYRLHVLLTAVGADVLVVASSTHHSIGVDVVVSFSTYHSRCRCSCDCRSALAGCVGRRGRGDSVLLTTVGVDVLVVACSTHHSRCRCSCDCRSALAGCVGRRARGGN